jgi:hypothetical protein
MYNYLTEERPAPGTGPKHRGNGTGPHHTRAEIATMVAVAMLKRGEGKPLTWTQLLSDTKAHELHKRFNAIGDSTGTKYLGLDRTDGNLVKLDKTNLARAAFWLKDVGTATENVCQYFTDLTPGQNLLAYVGLVDPPSQPTALAGGGTPDEPIVVPDSAAVVTHKSS